MHDEPEPLIMSTAEPEYRRLPGLFRIWDLQFVLDRRDDYQIQFDSMTEDRTPLFAVYRRPGAARKAVRRRRA